jgi:hypothetical protein
MGRLGKNQIDFLAGICLGRAYIVGDKMMRSLASNGCLQALGKEGDSFYVITADGLRAVADALDSGKLPAQSLDAFKMKAPH